MYFLQDYCIRNNLVFVINIFLVVYIYNVNCAGIKDDAVVMVVVFIICYCLLMCIICSKLTNLK